MRAVQITLDGHLLHTYIHEVGAVVQALANVYYNTKHGPRRGIGCPNGSFPNFQNKIAPLYTRTPCPKPASHQHIHSSAAALAIGDS